MAEVTNTLPYEVLTSILARFDTLDIRLAEVWLEVSAVRPHVTGLPRDVNNIHGVLARHDARLDRIAPRLELADAH